MQHTETKFPIKFCLHHKKYIRKLWGLGECFELQENNKQPSKENENMKKIEIMIAKN